MVRRIIFDLDNTLIPWNEQWWDTVEETFHFFHLSYNKQILPFFKKAIDEYEKNHLLLDKIELSRYLSGYLSIDLPDSFVEKWTFFLGECDLVNDSRLISLIKKLSQKYSLVIATNWFYDQQKRKLERLGIFQYFDELITSENYVRKPKSEMYAHLTNGYSKKEVIMVGDSYCYDIQGAINYGIYSYYITDSNSKENNEQYTVISSIYDLEEYL